MSFKVFTYILRNILLKRNRDFILSNYAKQLSLNKKNNILEVAYIIVLIERYN